MILFIKYDIFCILLISSCFSIAGNVEIFHLHSNLNGSLVVLLEGKWKADFNIHISTIIATLENINY